MSWGNYSGIDERLVTLNVVTRNTRMAKLILAELILSLMTIGAYCKTLMKHTLGIRDQKGCNRCPEWGPGTKVGVPEKGKIKKKSKAF